MRADMVHSDNQPGSHPDLNDSLAAPSLVPPIESHNSNFRNKDGGPILP